MDTYTDIEKQEPGANNHTPSSLGYSNSQTIATSPLARCAFSWKNLSYSVDTAAGKKQILRNVNGYVEKGTFDMLENELNDRDTSCAHGSLGLW